MKIYAKLHPLWKDELHDVFSSKLTLSFMNIHAKLHPLWIINEELK